MAELGAVVAHHDDCLAGEVRRPGGHVDMGAANGGGHEPGVGIEVFRCADIDDDGTSRGCHQLHEFVGRNDIGSGHGGAFQVLVEAAMLGLAPEGENRASPAALHSGSARAVKPVEVLHLAKG